MSAWAGSSSVFDLVAPRAFWLPPVAAAIFVDRDASPPPPPPPRPVFSPLSAYLSLCGRLLSAYPPGDFMIFFKTGSAPHLTESSPSWIPLRSLLRLDRPNDHN